MIIQRIAILLQPQRIVTRYKVVACKLVPFLVCLLALQSSCLPAFSQGDKGIESRKLGRITGTVTNAPNNLYPFEETARVTTVCLAENESQKEISNIITLSVIEESNTYIASDFTANITVDIKYGADVNSLQTKQQVFTVTYTKAGGAVYNAKKYFQFSGAAYVEIEIVDIDVSGISEATAAGLLLLENEMRITRFYDLVNGVAPDVFAADPATTTSDELGVHWAWPATAGNNGTQLEWTWLENELEGNYLVSGAVDKDLLFKNNASRVDLGPNQLAYGIPLFYDGVGKLYYRIRPVSNKTNGNRGDGKWYYPTQPYSANGHNNDLNWQAMTSFAEEGKSKTVMQYFDGTLRNRQTVTRDNSTKTTVTAETIYDGQGRPAIQILPAPGISNIIEYTKNLNKFNGQADDEDPLAYFDFAPTTLPGNRLTTALSTAKGTAFYYSSLNTTGNAAIPDAEGYPYTVTRYTPDATGRIESQSGVGAAMKMGSGHEMKYFYGTPSQEELDGLFGTEVGDYSHYSKNMVRDANGQLSVSYVDMHGRTVATALAGTAPANMVSLNYTNSTHYPGQAGTAMIRNLLDNNSNVVKNNSIESINTILVPSSGLYQFSYELDPQALQMPGCAPGTLCYDCMYDLEISITDESGETLPFVKKYNNISLTADDNCSTGVAGFKDENNNPITDNKIVIDRQLGIGSYIVRKTLTISETSLAKYKAEYLEKALCKTEQQLIDSIRAELLLVSDCNTPVTTTECEQCNAALGNYSDYEQAYLTSLGNPTLTSALAAEITASFNAQLLSCERLCNSKSQELPGKRRQMLQDMFPSLGQYAKDNEPATGPVTMYRKYDIFSATGPVRTPYYKVPWNSSKAPDYYYIEDNIIDNTIYTNGVLHAMNQQEFTELFQEKWAESLLPHHPEYDKLRFAEINLAPSYNWINTFENTDTYAAADGNGYLFTNAGNITDLFYVQAPGLKAGMATKINSNYISSNGKNFSMWQIAYGNIFCKDITDPGYKEGCYVNAPKTPAYTGMPPEQKDEIWKQFRILYTAERTTQVNGYITTSVPLGDAQTLVDQGYTLRFPQTTAQTATQYGFNWFPTTPGGAPVLTNLPGGGDPDQTFAGNCDGYIQHWRLALLQCTALAQKSEAVREQILNEITTGMLAVCNNATNAANPQGASNVSPAAPSNIQPRSFEEVINAVFAKPEYNIAPDTYCNPYVIQYPKPYGKSTKFTTPMISVVDSCTCARFAVLKTEAAAAGKQTWYLPSMNEYLLATYGDVLSPELFRALSHCGTNLYDSSSNYERSLQADTVYYTNTTALSLPQPRPDFLACDFTGTDCLDCAKLASLTAEFKTIFPAPYNTAPITTGNTYSEAELSYNQLFERFLNYRTGLQLSWMDYARAQASAGCGTDAAFNGPLHLEVSNRSGNPVEYVASERVELLEGFVSNDNDVFEIRIASGAGGTTKVMCLDPRPLTDPGGYLPPVDKCQEIYDLAIEMAQDILQIRKAALLAQFEAAYRAECLQAKDIEVFTAGYTNSEYHYTLYYYDQAGGLVKTVPPKGVRPDFSSTYTNSVKAARAAGNYLAPRPHELVTQYRYNSLGQVVAQRSPDAGDSRFWYDRLGRLAVSQNAQQADDNTYSYTKYDLLGRITEVGQKPQSTAMDQSTSQDETALNSWLNAGSAKEQLTRTVYDLPYGYATNVNGILCGTYLCQLNLRNRVSYTMVFDTDPGAAIGTQTAATYYTYDIHGNVDQLLQDYNGVAAMSAADRFKLMSYEYDLISGKVNKVSYQSGKTDAFYHRYSYDAENRLTEVWTSRDQLVWERDAAYRYYKHGPLARMELGQLKVQGADYAYTLQGWLKGVNSTELHAATDLGRDGLASGPNANAARDIMGFALHYYDESSLQDYTPISGTSAFARPNNTAFKSLYNGNIGGMSVNNGALAKGVASTTNALPLFYNYRYDQLNRLVSMQAYKGLASNTWTPVALDDYKEAISYDPNGNILTYNRNGSPEISGKATAMDELTYNYYATTNRLQQVSDAVTGTNYTEDIDQQSNSSNYTYDKIGNLKTDVAEGITAINWSVYGKISSIVKAAGTISYSYDVSGNRIAKTFLGKTTVYVRDASGNVMSVYEKPASGTLVQLETHLYGSSRIGLASQQSVVPESGITLASGYGTATLSTFTRNEKIFEVSNHLGNVLATVSDKKLQVDGNTDGVVDYYTADVVSASDYAPFGMGLVGRKYESAKYRYGFNGKENDNDVKGEGEQQDYGMRIYDPRLGRFLSYDPLIKEYCDLSPYHFAGDNPIQNIDMDGGEPKDFRRNWRYVQMSVNGGAPVGNDGEWSAIGTIRYQAVYDNVTKQYWFINHNNDGTWQYWKHNPGADQTRRIVSSTGKLDNGQWMDFETTDAVDARAGIESATLIATTSFCLFTAPFAIEASVAAGGAAATAVEAQAVNLTTKVLIAYWKYAPLVGYLGNKAAEFLDESGSVGMQNASLKKIAFGFERNARQLAQEINGSHLMDFKGDWKSEFMEIIKDKTKELHFSLNDLEGSLYKNILDPGRSSTNWELNQLYQNKDAFERTIFHVEDKTYIGSQIFDAKL